MSDEIAILVNGKRLDRFLEYRVESSLFRAASSFDIELAGTDNPATAGALFKLLVNDELCMTGLVDAVECRMDKRSLRRTLRGRDLMGLLVDSHPSVAGDLEGPLSITALAERLLADIPFLNRSPVMVGKGDKSRAIQLDDLSQPDRVYIKAGETVFEALRKRARVEGMLFWLLPDGTLVFGTPATGGKADFSVICRKSGRGNNVMESAFSDDISRRYKTVTVYASGQGQDYMEVGETESTGSVEDPDFPFAKRFVVETNTSSRNPEGYARLLMDRGRFQGFSLGYTVPGHTQNGKPWTVNAICHVEDDVNGFSGNFLIHERTFELSKDRGAVTHLRLSRLGVLPA